MKIRNVGRNKHLVAKSKDGNVQIIHPGDSQEVDSKKAKVLLASYPQDFVSDEAQVAVSGRERD